MPVTPQREARPPELDQQWSVPGNQNNVTGKMAESSTPSAPPPVPRKQKRVGNQVESVIFLYVYLCM